MADKAKQDAPKEEAKAPSQIDVQAEGLRFSADGVVRSTIREAREDEKPDRDSIVSIEEVEKV